MILSYKPANILSLLNDLAPRAMRAKTDAPPVSLTKVAANQIRLLFQPLLKFPVHDAHGAPVIGNFNSSHAYGLDLTDAERRALVEYLKTL